MTDFRQQQTASTLTAPAARGLAPHSLVQPQGHPAYPAATEIPYGIVSNKKGYGLYKTNITITILGKYSIDNSSSPDSHLK